MYGVMFYLAGMLSGVVLSLFLWRWHLAVRHADNSDMIERIAKSICAAKDPDGDWRNYVGQAESALHAWNEAIEKAPDVQ